MIYKKGSNEKLSEHFNQKEFDCTCTSPTCTTTLIDPELIQRLELVRSYLGAPIQVTSGYRCQAKQQQLRATGFETSIGLSQHELGRAADIRSAEMDKLVICCEQEFRAIGVANSFIHVDLRTDKIRRWSYK